jgi:SAM-dependent methyltransferase
MLPFCSPRTLTPLKATSDFLVGDGERFPIVDGIPRFVDSESYAAAFGLEWKIHARTQLDSRTGRDISRRRLERCLGCGVSTWRDCDVLEAGCGAGRFTELLVGAGAHVHAVDLSRAVEANRDNIGTPPNYSVAQADLRALPFAPKSFDLVLCLGVLQHTPSPESSLEALWRQVKPGGLLVIDHYSWNLSIVTKLAPLYRLICRRLEPQRAKRLCDRLVDLFFPIHWAVRGFFPAQMLLSRVSPCLVYFRAFPELSRAEHLDFCRLDTFDHLTDVYKHLRTAGQIRRALEALAEVDRVEVTKGGNGVEARAYRRSPER